MSEPASVRSVVVLGAGVVGTSVGLSLRRGGVHVQLDDPDPAALAAAVAKGAGVALDHAAGPADVVVIACPPSSVPEALFDAMSRGLGRSYTDVASVKGPIVAAAARAGCDLAAYVPGHPVVAGDLGLASTPDAELFDGRTWYLCPRPETSPQVLQAAAAVVRQCRAVCQVRGVDQHDRHLAAVSHLPRLVTSAVAAQFELGDESLFPLRGSRFHETLQAAGGAPGLWADTVEQNAEQVAEALERVTRELSAVARALRAGHQHARDELDRLLAAGRRGHARVTEHARKTSPGADGVPGPDEEWFWVR